MLKGDSALSEVWSGETTELEGLGYGISGIVLIIDRAKVIKVSKNDKHMEIEARVYEIVMRAKKRSPHILHCFGLGTEGGLILERCVVTLRQRLILCDVDAKVWAIQAAEGLAFLHENKIIQADVGCHNMLVDANDVVKLCDFAGSSIAGSPSLITCDVRARIPFKRQGESTTTSDLFALGSAFYEMSTKEMPYKGKRDREIQPLYEQGIFPQVEKLESLGRVIRKCWLTEYKSALDVIAEIDSKCCCVED